MTSELASSKVTAAHLKRDAYLEPIPLTPVAPVSNRCSTRVASPCPTFWDRLLYVRQSTIRQVVENTESTQRQYALRQRAVALGWPLDRIMIIDSEQGQSGALPGERAGFQRLVAEVGMGQAGIVLGLEVSRLARNNSDWHRLLEICALSDTLILDEDGLYDPSHFNDRLLLGLKGTMSEAEIHVLKARLRGSILNKAKRGELECPLPMGLLYNAEGEVVLDPDTQVQESLHLVFRTFRRMGSAMGTVKVFRRQGLKFPRRLRGAPNKGDLVWGPLNHKRVLDILHNLRYAGAFVFGRGRTYKRPNGTLGYRKLSQDQWDTLIRDAHPGYITWQEYEENERPLRENAASFGSERHRSPPREGPALLQGLALCGRCGTPMAVRYHQRYDRLVPDYVCQRGCVRHGEPVCQVVPGTGVDEAIGELLLASVSPMALEVSLRIQDELQTRLDEADRLRRQQVERAGYEAELARRRFMQVAPDNRLVADTLEGEWNEKLRLLTETQKECERLREQDHAALDQQQRAQILALATDFPRLWRDPQTPDRERKRMVRLLLKDVTLVKGDKITIHVRFKGGACQTLTRPIPPNAWQKRKTSPEVVAEIDRLLDKHTDAQIAVLLNERGYRSGADRSFSPLIVGEIRRVYNLKSRYDRLRARGLLTQKEVASILGVSVSTIKDWRQNGLLRAHLFNDKNEALYEPPGDSPPIKHQGRKLTDKRQFVSNPAKEVQCGT